MNVIKFERDDSFSVTPLGLDDGQRQGFEKWLMLFYTGSSRLSSDYAKKLINNLEANAKHMTRMHEMVAVGADLLHARKIEEFGRLLPESWALKRGLANGTSTSTIDRIYDDAQRAGALGGKLLGAGGTGFMVFVVPPERQPAVAKALSHLITVPISADFHTGSTIVYRKEELLGAGGSPRDPQGTGWKYHDKARIGPADQAADRVRGFPRPLHPRPTTATPTSPQASRSSSSRTTSRCRIATCLRGIHGDTKT